MPWKVKTTMEQKVEFISAWRTQKHTITELCKSFEISRTTAYRLIDRFEEFGLDGLIERKKTPKTHSSQTSDKVVKNILDLKEKYPRWGAKKIRELLFKSCLEKDVPSVVTVHNILKKNGLVKPQKRHKRIQPIYPIFDPKKPNELWSEDYKGKFYMGNRKYCHALTIADSKSRYVFAAKGHYHENTKNVKA
jgi:transposase